jgi:aminoglycoside/choline kinase family phosphotransferase
MDSAILKTLFDYTGEEKSDLIKLKGDASSREYYRDKSHQLVLCHYHKDSDGFHNFTEFQKILRDNSIRTPKVLHIEFPVLVQEDLGDISLETNPTLDNYLKVIDILIGFQSLPTKFEYKKEDHHFTKEKFMWELNFAVEHLNKLIPVRNQFDLEAEFESICDFILKTPQCPCHRDFHSKNLMIKSEGLYVIDFQDARMGPFLYDLVSLLEDPYVQLKSDEKEKLKEKFLELSTIKYDGDFETLYNVTAIQRIFKACGSFASLKNLKNNDGYLKYLRTAFSCLLEILDTTEYTNLKDFVGLNHELWKLSDTY